MSHDETGRYFAEADIAAKLRREIEEKQKSREEAEKK
jgi:hypothetical protein